ncbi:MAG: peroxidase [Rhodocyclaceae bacterium]|jgi:putative iron-dependent peroxidase|nr:peroxidase [Rhodocyclaceae bacterium]
MVAKLSQPGILAPLPPCGRSLTFRLALEAEPRPALVRLRDGFDVNWGVAGFGEPLVRALGGTVPGLRTFLSLSGPACAVPAKQASLWIFLRGEDRGALFDASERVGALLDPAFVLDDAVDTFLYDRGRDLTGYEDGTENPKGDDAAEAALVQEGAGLAGSSFVAVQRWVHDLAHFRRHTPAECDATIGRRRDDNEEIDDAPASAHVKRSAQESFDPPAFMLRRSMPWATAHEQGLEFIAYGKSLDPFEHVLRRMAGLDDGIADALFTFSRPVTGGHYWCPPIAAGRLDLSRLGEIVD